MAKVRVTGKFDDASKAAIAKMAYTIFKVPTEPIEGEIYLSIVCDESESNDIKSTMRVFGASSVELTKT